MASGKLTWYCMTDKGSSIHVMDGFNRSNTVIIPAKWRK